LEISTYLSVFKYLSVSGLNLDESAILDGRKMTFRRACLFNPKEYPVVVLRQSPNVYIVKGLNAAFKYFEWKLSNNGYGQELKLIFYHTMH